MEIERIEYRGFTIRIVSEDNPESPREWDNTGKMYCWHGRYNLGDKHDYRTPDDMLLALIQDVHPDFPDELLGTEHAHAIIDKHYRIKPLYLYDHSGIAISTTPFSCRWDSGQVGYIVAALKDEDAKSWDDKIVTWNGRTITFGQRIDEILDAEVETYDAYLRGDVAGYIIERECCDDGEEYDSCWGYYPDEKGSWSSLIEECKAHVDEAWHRAELAEANRLAIMTDEGVVV